jgi:hypothetical protein
MEEAEHADVPFFLTGELLPVLPFEAEPLPVAA